MEQQECKCPPAGAPAWMATFADLMSLLMCFFVLLLSFSEMDVQKFRQIAGSMRYAFGVQNILKAEDVPRGTSVIAQEFRPGRPEPTPIEVIMQQTIDMTKQTLDFQEGEFDRGGGQQRDNFTLGGDKGKKEEQEENNNSNQLIMLAEAIKDVLKKEIEDGAIDVDNLGQQLVIRIKEKGLFPSESAFLQPKFRPVIQTIATLVKDIPGSIRVSGHSDDVRLESELYRSSLDLSAQRAVSVAQEMLKVEGLNLNRIRVEGFADAMPRVPNTSFENRAINRRVEISIMQGKAMETDEISSTGE